MYVSYWFMSFSIIIWEWYINFVIAKEISIRKSFHFRFCFLFSFLFRFRFLNWYESHLDQMVVLDDSKNSSQETSSSFSCLSPISFSHSISVKLTNSNFLSRKQQILVAVPGYKRQHFLDNSIQKKKKINSKYLDWEQQNQLLMSWLLSSMSENLLLWMLGSRTSVDESKDFSVQSTRKGDSSIVDYLLKIKSSVDLLASAGHVISNDDHIEVIFDGLPSNYDTFIQSTRLEQMIIVLMKLSHYYWLKKLE